MHTLSHSLSLSLTHTQLKGKDCSEINLPLFRLLTLAVHLSSLRVCQLCVPKYPFVCVCVCVCVCPRVCFCVFCPLGLSTACVFMPLILSSALTERGCCVLVTVRLLQTLFPQWECGVCVRVCVSDWVIGSPLATALSPLCALTRTVTSCSPNVS